MVEQLVFMASLVALTAVCSLSAMWFYVAGEVDEARARQYRAEAKARELAVRLERAERGRA